jgi:hypothetical protein
MLYLIGRKHADAMLGLARQDAEAKVVLLHDGVYLHTPGLRDVYALQADVERAGVRPMATIIDDAALVKLILEHKTISHL